jgi:Uma2 family endonuclease
MQEQRMGALDSPWITRHRLTVEEYHRMAQAGVLAPDARVELIEGEVIDMAPIGSRHWSVVNRLNRMLTLAVGEQAIVSVQSPLRLGPRSEPQPDLTLLKPQNDFYAHSLPTTADTLLVVEVADTTGAYDRQVKLPLYARHGVPELWIVDLEMAVLRVCRQPAGETYREIETLAAPGLQAIAALPGVTIDLAGILPAD